MFKNLGSWDRWLRLALGALVLSLVFWGPKTQLGWLGLIFILTGMVGHCPIYLMLGLNSCSLDRKKGGNPS